MPELPEVETTKRGISPHVLQQRIANVTIRQRSLRWPIPDNIEQILTGQRITAIERRAKYLLLYLEHNTQKALLIHLGMSGSLRIAKPDDAILKHDHADIGFENGLILRYSDPRRFGCILWLDTPPIENKLLSHLGPEPLSEEFDGDYLWQKSRGKSIAVKQFVMDQKVVTGIGNIYATEALFTAGIHPNKAAGKVSKAKYALFVADAKRILERSITQGGTTLRDFVGGDGKPGYFAQQLLVYGRKGEPCPNCATTLKEIRLSNRSSVYCSQCQK
ncbi:bifunctional DNA-formamidopyrimidine glycosylase/DNA-(apurinic or apyrimidinic site) lyase [Planctobacterium marinum]|uniref:Formamidopyrimidine-DNA glycosylase n=1 Tax=Planctobacterium marinum TaxID=1631968 RepID=A0AA48KNM2_9ALTE|nr:formamidopyrimidine-DNA glycosylase [Planctobacterium marinum]